MNLKQFIPFTDPMIPMRYRLGPFWSWIMPDKATGSQDSQNWLLLVLNHPIFSDPIMKVVPVGLKIRAFPTTKWYIIIFSDIYIYIPYHVQAYLDASAATPVPAPVPAASHIFQRPISSVVGRVKRLATRSARLMPGPTWAEAPGWPAWRGNIFQNQRV